MVGPGHAVGCVLDPRPEDGEDPANRDRKLPDGCHQAPRNPELQLVCGRRQRDHALLCPADDKDDEGAVERGKRAHRGARPRPVGGHVFGRVCRVRPPLDPLHPFVVSFLDTTGTAALRFRLITRGAFQR